MRERTPSKQGGPAPLALSWPPWPYFAEDEIAAATAVLRSGRVNYWTGTEGRRFEEEFAQAVGCRYGVALANGTVALEMILQALGIGPGDEVIVPCRTFIASSSAVVMRGAVPVLADIDPVSQNITAETIVAALTPRTKAVVVVHLAGWPCEMESIMALAREKGLRVVEDCAQAHGATLNGRSVGSFGDAAAFSFCQDKIMTTGGEGGMVVTDSQQVWERVWSMKDHGKGVDALTATHSGHRFRFLHHDFGTNGRMTEMQAAIGRLQLRKLPAWVEARRRNAAILTDCFRGVDALRVTEPPAGVGHSYYKYYAFLRPERLAAGWDRNRILDALAATGVPCMTGSCPEIYLEQAFIRRGLSPADRLPVARQLGETSLMFLVHPTLGAEEMGLTCDAVRTTLAKASV